MHVLASCFAAILEFLNNRGQVCLFVVAAFFFVVLFCFVFCFLFCFVFVCLFVF